MRPLFRGPPEARRADRVALNVAQARLRQQGARSITIAIKNLSRLGFRAEWPHVVRLGQVFWLTLPNLAPLMATAVWTKEFDVGCKFESPIHPAVFRMLIARYGIR